MMSILTAFQDVSIKDRESTEVLQNIFLNIIKSTHLKVSQLDLVQVISKMFDKFVVDFKFWTIDDQSMKD